MSNLAGGMLAVATGGAIGAALRYATTLLVAERAGWHFPWHTLTVNVTGSFLIGILAVLLPPTEHANSMFRLWLVTGLLGGYTTFSAFSMETLALLHQGQTGRALAYAGLSVVSCLVAVAIGYELMRWLRT